MQLTKDQYLSLLDLWHFLGGIPLINLPYADQLGIPQQRKALHAILSSGYSSISVAMEARGFS